MTYTLPQLTQPLTAVPCIRILITDDHDVVREGLAAILTPRHQMQVVALAANGLEAVSLFRQHQPDITLMDLRMPQMDGLTAIKTIRAEFPQARIIVLTSFDGEEENCFRAGAKAVVLKDAPRAELFAAIRAVYHDCANEPATNRDVCGTSSEQV